MEHLLQKSKCSIFHNIFNTWYFKGVLWSKGLKYSYQLSLPQRDDYKTRKGTKFYITKPNTNLPQTMKATTYKKNIIFLTKLI